MENLLMIKYISVSVFLILLGVVSISSFADKKSQKVKLQGDIMVFASKSYYNFRLYVGIICLAFGLLLGLHGISLV